MANNRREDELVQALQEIQATLPAPGGLEQRMIRAADVLQSLPFRERLALLSALLPETLGALDAEGRTAFLDRLAEEVSQVGPG